MGFHYHIYGLHIASSRAIGVLKEKPAADPDMVVTWTHTRSETPDAALSWERVITRDLEGRKEVSFFHAQNGEGRYTKLHFNTERGGIDFLLHADQEQLWIIHDKNEAESDLDSYFVGPVLGCMLRLKNVICLHASVVNIDNQAIAIMGKKRSGKSTTAAAFTQRGFSVLADDMAVVTIKKNIFYIEPGYARVRLRPASLAAIHSGDAENFPLVYSSRNSRYTNVEEHFYGKALPLSAIYMLNNSAAPGIKPFVETIREAEKVIRLNENTFGNYVITQDLRKKEFEMLGKLAAAVPVRKLVFGQDLQTLGLQCEAIIEDVRRTSHQEKI